MVPALMTANVSLQKIRDQNDQAIVATPDGFQNITSDLTALLAT